jgi:hypothetical protein
MVRTFNIFIIASDILTHHVGSCYERISCFLRLLAHSDEVLPADPSTSSGDENTTSLEGTTEPDRLGSDGDEVTKNDAEEQKDSTASTVAKSLKCNEYVILN